MTLRSGHVHIDDKWKQTLDDAVEAGQEYVICSSMPARAQTVDNYKKTAEVFNKSGEECNKHNLKFGYHNHEYEFESEKGEVLFDVLVKNTDANLVHMELDLGWVIIGGKNPLDYFKNFPGRFPLWHVKDLDAKRETILPVGEGTIDYKRIFDAASTSGMKHFFVEHDMPKDALASITSSYNYLKKMLAS